MWALFLRIAGAITTLILLLFVGVGTLHANASQAQEPKRVEIGVWFNGVHSIDFLDGSFGAEFYLWWISSDPDFQPFKEFQILNGRSWSTRSTSHRQLSDGSYYTSGMVSAAVNHDWDLIHYPFDRQRLQIIIETPYTSSELRLVPNRNDSVVSQFVDLQGFELTGLSIDEYVEKYETNFGLREIDGKQFSRVVIEIDLKRDSGRIVLAVLIGFMVANLIALFTYTIHVSVLSVRATMVGSAIFAAVGNTYLVNSVVHPAVGSLLLDRIALGTFGAILVALLNAIVVERLYSHKKVQIARKLNWAVFFVVLVGSIVFYSVAFQEAIEPSLSAG